MKTWLQSRRFFLQILTLTVSLLLTLCIFFVAILYTNSRKSTEKKIFQTESDRNAELSRQSEIYLRQLIYIGSSFGNLAVPYESLTTSENLWTRTVFETMLESHLNSSNYISSIDISLKGKSLYPTQVTHEKHMGEYFNYDIWGANEPSWPYLFDLTTRNDITFTQVTLTLNGYQLSKQLFTYKSKERLEYFLTADGTVLLTNQKKSFFQNIDELLPGIDLSESSISRQTIGTYQDYYYVLSDPNKYDFRILTLVPRSFYSNQYTVVFFQTLLMAGCLFLVAVFISVFLTFRFYRPIKNTVELLKTYIPDDLHEYENEIAFIHQHISKYAAKQSTAMTAVSETFSQIQSAQTAVMQYQINSHFLFNTLENIRSISIAELGIKNEVETSILLLNTIIREGVFQKKIFVSLAHELHLARCYLELMFLRFADVEVQWALDESLSQCQVFKFSLQPVLENCFSHAFKGSLERPKMIHISVSRKDHDFSIIVRDNGIGIDADTSIATGQVLHDSEQENSSHHVGIRNIHKRITDTFGQDYGIQISGASPGTVVEIRYPIVITPPGMDKTEDH